MSIINKTNHFLRQVVNELLGIKDAVYELPPCTCSIISFTACKRTFWEEIVTRGKNTFHLFLFLPVGLKVFKVVSM